MLVNAIKQAPRELWLSAKHFTAMHFSQQKRLWLRTFANAAAKHNVFDANLSAQLALSAPMVRLPYLFSQQRHSSIEQLMLDLCFELNREKYREQALQMPELWRLRNFCLDLYLAWYKANDRKPPLNVVDSDLISSLDEATLYHRKKLIKRYSESFSNPTASAVRNVTVWYKSGSSADQLCQVNVQVSLDQALRAAPGFFLAEFAYSTCLDNRRVWLEHVDMPYERVKA
ncbi:MAG: hypothetical protein ACPG4U_10245 [Pseudomonadales bacterium]